MVDLGNIVDGVDIRRVPVVPTRIVRSEIEASNVDSTELYMAA